LYRQDRAKAVDILVKDLKVFSSFNEELYKEITQLLTLENFRLTASPDFICIDTRQIYVSSGSVQCGSSVPFSIISSLVACLK